MLAEGRTTIAATPEEHDALTPDGWGTIPLAVHLAAPGLASRHPSAPITLRVACPMLVEERRGAEPTSMAGELVGEGVSDQADCPELSAFRV